MLLRVLISAALATAAAAGECDKTISFGRSHRRRKHIWTRESTAETAHGFAAVRAFVALASMAYPVGSRRGRRAEARALAEESSTQVARCRARSEDG